MKKYLLIAYLPLALLLFGGFGFSASAAAYNPFGGNKDPTICNQTDVNGNKSPVCAANGSTNPLTGNDGLLTRVANIFALITGVAAVVVIIIGGFEYVRSSGDSAKINKAKDTILFAVIGLIVVLIARSIVALVVSKL